MPATPRGFSLYSGALIFVLSVLLVIPCFWHRHIEAGDLGSHVYNAWLAELIEQGRAPGLYTVTQWDNVLFDVLLLNLAKLFGLSLAEKFATSLGVLIFFWGVFALMTAVSSRPPWLLTPCIAMLSYGYIFHLGFLNFYLSLGLGCIGLSLVWSGHREGWIAPAALAPVVLLAHPLGFLFLLGVGTYRQLWRKGKARSKWLLPVCVLGTCLVVRFCISHFGGSEVEWREVPFWWMTGADQFHVFGGRYASISLGVAVLVVASTVFAALGAQDGWGFWKQRRLILELYFVSFLGTLLLPENLRIDSSGGWVGAVASRLTLVTAIFGLCWLATLPPLRWHVSAGAALALVFFVFLYQDTALLNRMEHNTENITQQLPFGTRTVATFFGPPDYRTVYLHIPDRACIGHCFLFSNYEPSSRQFRIRVEPGSPVVTSSQDDSEDMQSGTYDVEEEDLPLKQIYQCEAGDLTRICIRDLAGNEKNGRLGYHRNLNSVSSQNP